MDKDDISQIPLNHWNYFLALESDLKTISRYIEIHEDNYSVFSIALAQLLLATCAEVEVILKEICALSSDKKTYRLEDYFIIINEHHPKFFDKPVALRINKIQLQPFKDWTKVTPPIWWNGYNAAKHQRNKEYKQANLKNCIDALGALYISIFEYLRVHKGITDKEYSTTFLYKHLNPKSELFLLHNEDFSRAIIDGKINALGINKNYI